MKRNCRVDQGFTLLELLIVIGVIGILAALLLSAFSRARDKGMTTACASNVHQINVAVAMYRDNNGDSFPWTWTGTNVGRGVCWFTYLQPYLASTNAILCPTKERWRIGKPLAYIFSENGTISDYAANYQIGGHDAPGLSPLRGGKDTTIARPSTTVYVVDAGTQPLDTIDPSLCVTSRSPEKKQCWVLDDPAGAGGVWVCEPPADINDNWCGPSIRHSGRSNIGFTDGHHEAMKPNWYYHWTPWLNPALGGGSTQSAPPRGT
jgi:prepilin-type N-terminal cleavage/methylation domain-containing protein/prepilin-type processing-associated H-X9-DG protein